MMDRRACVSMVVSTLIPAGTALGTLGVCAIPTHWVCCAGWNERCETFEPFHVQWVCAQTSSGAHNVVVAVPTPPGFFGETLDNWSVLVGSCTITTSKCGVEANSCIPTGAITQQCFDSQFYGTCYVP